MLLVAGVATLAASEAPNAVTIFDAYLAHAARTAPEYRTELLIGDSAEAATPGRMLARGPIAGTFTFRPKTYNELSRVARAEMLRDPKFRAFLLAMRTQADRAPADAATHGAVPLPQAPNSRPTLERFEISADEMLRRRPLFIVLAPP